MIKKTLLTTVMLLVLSVSSRVSAITFDYTGRLIIAAPGASSSIDLHGPGGADAYSPVSGTFDTSTGEFTVSSVIFADGNLSFYGGSFANTGGGFYVGDLLFDWSVNANIPARILWDGTGLDDAIAYGLEVGDILSGTDLYRDGIIFGGNGDGIGDPGELLTNISSVTPYSDSLMINPADLQGPAPLAALPGSTISATSQVFTGFEFYLDIGSGNSMYVTSVSSVPVPPAVWLFGSGLVGLLGVSRSRHC